MGCKHAYIFYPVNIPYKPLIPYVFYRPFISEQQFQRKKTGMSLIHVVFFYLKSEFIEHPYPGYAEDDFLF